MRNVIAISWALSGPLLGLLPAGTVAFAQSVQPSPSHQVPHPSRNITATGVTKPPSPGLGGSAPLRPDLETDMLKAQKAAEERNKAWDAKMRRTMGTICNGC